MNGQEMLINTVLKMFGITTDDAKRDIVRAVQAVLTFDTRMANIERDIAAIKHRTTAGDDIEQSTAGDESTAPRRLPNGAAGADIPAG